MIEAFRKIWHFAGNERKNINKSFRFNYLNGFVKCHLLYVWYDLEFTVFGEKVKKYEGGIYQCHQCQ